MPINLLGNWLIIAQVSMLILTIFWTAKTINDINTVCACAGLE